MIKGCVSIYPLGGLGYARATAHLSDLGIGWKNVSDGKIAVNLGAGMDFRVASNIKLNLELKYQIVDNFNQLVLSAGVSFGL